MTPESLAVRLQAEVAAVGVELTDPQVAQLIRYLGLIRRWRQVAGLTAVADPLRAARVHVADSLLCLRAEVAGGAAVLDVGSGAGFPGIPLVIVRPDLRLTLLEADAKKVGFLERAVSDLGMAANVIAGRAEKFATQMAGRERYDVVVARAVAPMRVLLELVLPLTRPGGKAILLKGPRIKQELAGAARVIEILGGAPPFLVEAELGGGEQRTVVVVPKLHPTPQEFPRRPGVPQKRPL